jgi:hypothetical protein
VGGVGGVVGGGGVQIVHTPAVAPHEVIPPQLVGHVPVTTVRSQHGNRPPATARAAENTIIASTIVPHTDNR